MSTIFYNIKAKFETELADLKKARNDIVYVGPNKQTRYIAYKNGESKTFENKRDAEKFSHLVETHQVITNKDEVEAHEKAVKVIRKKIDKIEQEIYDTWIVDLRQFYSTLNDEQFKLVYAMANEAGHSSGYGEIETYFDDFASLVIDCIKAIK